MSKFKIGDKVVWVDKEYAKAFSLPVDQIMTVKALETDAEEGCDLVFLEEHGTGAFDYRIKLFTSSSVEQDKGKHYRFSFKQRLTEQDKENGFVVVNLDPYRISATYELGGWREHIVKKTLRGTEKGHTEQELIDELQCCLDRAKQMLEEEYK